MRGHVIPADAVVPADHAESAEHVRAAMAERCPPLWGEVSPPADAVMKQDVIAGIAIDADSPYELRICANIQIYKFDFVYPHYSVFVDW